jgi:hypothetical protein
VRWGRAGSGKRGGVRVIYLYMDRDRPLYLVLVHAKTRRETLTADALKEVRAFAMRIKRAPVTKARKGRSR